MDFKLDTPLLETFEELDKLTEANKVINRVVSNPWYSGAFRGLNDISTKQTPKSAEEIAQAEEERRKQEKEEHIRNAMLYKKPDYYNDRYQQKILTDPEWPALDPETKERIYDPIRKEEVVKQSVERRELAQQQAYQKSLETKEANKLKKEQTYYWQVTYTINNRTYKVGKNVVGNDDPDTTCELMKLAALRRIKEEKHECTVFKEPFQWDNTLTIRCTTPRGSSRIVASVSVSEEELDKIKRKI